MPNDTYTATGSGRENTKSLTYDPKTGTWVPASSTSDSSTESTPKDNKEVPKESTSKVDSKKAAEKEYIKAEFNTLTGDLSVTPTEKSIRIRVNDTIRIEGLGKYLSGLYFVSSIKRTLSSDSGYSHTFSLLKNGFGDSLKKAQKDTVANTRKAEVPKTPSEIKVGDSVRIVGADAVYSNAHDEVKVPEWVKKKTLTVDSVSKDGTRVRLNPIFSWTYTKYVQKV